MYKKYLLSKIGILTVFFSLVSLSVFAQQVEIISIEGKVQVKQETSSNWEDASVGQILTVGAEIKTERDAKCRISFGKNRSSNVTLQGESNIKIEDIVPGEVFLNRGRVFTLIRNTQDVGDFKVRTPTAVTGARGTGWVTEFSDGVTSVSVFEDIVNVSGLDDSGEVISEVNVQQDFETIISIEGQAQEVQPVPEMKQHEWQNEVVVIERFMEEAPERPMGGKPGEVLPPGPNNPNKGKLDPQQQGQVKGPQQPQGPFVGNVPGQPGPGTAPIVIPGQGPGPGGFQPTGQQPPPPPMGDNGFNQYMQGQNQGPNGPMPEYNFQGDQYFGGFDQQWAWQGGQFVNDPYFQNQSEQNGTIIDGFKPPCPCPTNCSLPVGAFCPPNPPPPPP